jgi:D-beta-D-heptose 7-phosphate kinase/D-beta-D-heptose 1-phosphate adenosyltransferase
MHATPPARVINWVFEQPLSGSHSRWHGDPLNSAVLTLDDAILRFGREKRNGRRVVFTNGCFDLLHPGHIRMLEQARELGDILIVGLNSDASVRQLKGEARPVIAERERAEILAALECVDAVVIFDALTPREVIARLLPDVLVKGGDWPGDQIVGREEVEAAGGRVVSIPVVPGCSTSEILRKIRRGAHPPRTKS